MYSRGDKESHLETIRYEIDMLDYCFQRFRKTRDRGDRGENNAFLEGFLLHYRNLIEFLGGRPKRKTDLRLSRPKVWLHPRRRVDVSKLARPDLVRKYHRPISRYLQHCTEDRANVPREWNVEDMYDELNKLLSDFEQKVSLSRQVPGGVSVTQALTVKAEGEAAHTASFRWIGPLVPK